MLQILGEAMKRITVDVDNTIDQSRLEALAENPFLLLDVTKLDLERLPVQVKAELYTEATTFITSRLQISEDIHATKAKMFITPNLQEAGAIFADSATTFSADRLKATIKYAPKAGVFVALPLIQRTVYLTPKTDRDLRELAERRKVTAEEITSQMINDGLAKASPKRFAPAAKGRRATALQLQTKNNG
jgi:hypothetical protein